MEEPTQIKDNAWKEYKLLHSYTFKNEEIERRN